MHLALPEDRSSTGACPPEVYVHLRCLYTWDFEVYVHLALPEDGVEHGFGKASVSFPGVISVGLFPEVVEVDDFFGGLGLNEALQQIEIFSEFANSCFEESHFFGAPQVQHISMS